jgi:hypothetical protein
VLLLLLLLLLLLQDSSQMQQAFQWLETHPKQQHPNAKTWNGGLSAAQMTWLQLELAEAAMAGENIRPAVVAVLPYTHHYLII